MAIPQWTGRQSLAQPNINPTAAIDSAGRAFGNIADTLQKHELAAQDEQFRQAQMQARKDEFDQVQSLARDKFLFDKGADARALQARIAEENRLKAQAAERYKLFSTKAQELDNAQLESFSLNPDTYDALRRSGLNDDQIAALETKAKNENADLFLDRNKTLAGLMDFVASTGENPAAYAPLFETYKMRNNMGGVDEETAAFARDLALANARSRGSGGRGSGGGSSGSPNDANFARNVDAIRDEESFRNGSDAWYKDWFPGERTKVYKQDVTRIAEHALANNGIRPMYIAQAIKADMDDGQTEYNLADIATDPNDPDYQSILAAAELMQTAGNPSAPASGSGRNSPAPGQLGSAEFALSLGRGYQPVRREERLKVLSDMAKQEYPQLFGAPTTAGSGSSAETGSAKGVIESVVGGGSPDNIPKEDKNAMILDMAKKVIDMPGIAPPLAGSYGQFAPAPSRKTPEQQQLTSLVKILEQKPKPLVEMPNTAEYRLFPERWKDPNPQIRKENAELAKRQEKAYPAIFKILSGKKEAKQEQEAPKEEEKVLSQNNVIKARLEKRRAELASLLEQRRNR